MHPLFHVDQTITRFSAQVIDCRPTENGFRVELDNTAFYYTSGGQPHDTGMLGGQPVLGVEKADGRIWHFVAEPVRPGTSVACEVDWGRRFDHMCQHAGEHLMAWALRSLYGFGAIGLHIGAEVSTLDLMPGANPPTLSRKDLDDVERMVFERICHDDPIRCWFPSGDELAQLPLRKPAGEHREVRVVAMGDYEYVACGGTHPHSTGQIGLVRILSCNPSRGCLRVAFLAGTRAFNYTQAAVNQAVAASELLGTGAVNLSEYVQKTLSRLNDTQKRLDDTQAEYAMSFAEAVLASPRLCAEAEVLFGVLPALPQKAVRGLCARLLQKPGSCAVLVIGQDNGYGVIFARASGVALSMGEALKAAVTPFGGKGGGKPDFAAGSLPAGADLDAFRTAAYARFS